MEAAAQKKRKLEPSFDVSKWFDHAGNLIRSPEELQRALEEKFPTNTETLNQPKNEVLQDLLRAIIETIATPTINPEKFTQKIDKLYLNYPFPTTDLAEIIKNEGADNVLMSPGTKQKYISRKVDFGIKAKALVTLEPGRLPIITGESGSGKTWLMINSKEHDEVALYLVAHVDIEMIEEEKNIHSAKNVRDENAFQSVFNAVNQILGNIDRELLKDKKLLLLLDEVGSWPTFVRALCANPEQLASRLALGQGWASCRMMLAGTGIYAEAAGATTVGSHSSYFKVYRVPPQLSVWKALTLETKKESDSFVEFLDKNSSAQRLMENPRVAALAFQWIQTEGEKSLGTVMGGHPSDRALRSLLPTFLSSVALAYRKKNALSDVDSLGIEVYRNLSTALVLFPWLAEDPHRFPPHLLYLLVTRFGILVDLATFDGQDWTTPSPRFHMSFAQMELFRMAYGYKPATHTVTGEGFETTIVNYLEMLLLASHDMVTLPQLLEKLGAPASDEKTTAPSCSGIVSLPNSAGPIKTLKLAGVAIVQSNVKIQPTNVPELQKKMDKGESGWYEQMHASLGRGVAVILINAPESAFANIIVLIPKQAVVLLQAKDCTGEKVSAPMLSFELGKMGLVGENKTVFVGALESSEFPTDSECALHPLFKGSQKDLSGLLAILCELAGVSRACVHYALITTNPEPMDLSTILGEDARKVLQFQANEQSLAPIQLIRDSRQSKSFAVEMDSILMSNKFLTTKAAILKPPIPS